MAICVRFADFELDVGAYALRRPDGAVKLEQMPMDLLIMLVQRAGELILRDEIRSALWSDHINVEYDSAINTVIRKIRRASAPSAIRIPNSCVRWLTEKLITP